ncbi:SEC-C metal-binding domain-containing protein [Erythrobacter neustonensis]|uniref:SEC-C metal-binding domain-containing protein n=1 Tax=Erythrobacter neustonensis TaxID=1112 RepID=UPI0009EDC7D9|nr:SEC-C domain-containing protein [Erythrobacter neustonensis]
MEITKSPGVTPTEEFLAKLCERSFLKLWSYPNPWKYDGKELCDLLVVFENDVLVFFDRESNRLKSTDAKIEVEWPRWRKEVIDKQSKNASGAARYLKAGRGVFLDLEAKIPLPIKISPTARVHKIIVAHGAKEACKRYSGANVTGSLAVAYSPFNDKNFDPPFFVSIDKRDPFHVFDSENLGIVLNELDTISDFIWYLNAKLDAIERYTAITYCGEEDLVAHYLLNYDKKAGRHIIGVGPDFDFVHIREGEYEDFRGTEAYRRRKLANEKSRTWDNLIQMTAENALSGALLGDSDPFSTENPMHYMAKEPRFIRRVISERIEAAIKAFPENDAPTTRNVTLLPSFYDRLGYVFLQLKSDLKDQNLNEYRMIRTKILEIACASAKIKFPRLQKIVGIAIDAPKYAASNSEDFMIMDFSKWNNSIKKSYEKVNEEFKFFKIGKVKKIRASEFPAPHLSEGGVRKIGRNEKCPCGSGKKFKHCHSR